MGRGLGRRTCHVAETSLWLLYEVPAALLPYRKATLVSFRSLMLPVLIWEWSKPIFLEINGVIQSDPLEMEMVPEK